MTTTPTLDLAAVKQVQQSTWASGNYSTIAAHIHPVAERLVDTADLRAGWKVLDIATGSGNAAIAAARIGCDVTGSDYVPGLLDHARARTAAEGLAAAYVEGDAEALPFADRGFDAVTSVFGSMFAPDQPRTAAEAARVVRPGGMIALASWTPEGFIGEMFRTIGAHVPPPAGLTSPMRWGSPDGLGDLFGDRVAWTAHERRTFTFRFASAEDFADVFGRYYGPTLKALEKAGDDAPALREDLVALAARWDRLGDATGAIAVDAEYLESVGTVR